jgi:hypothetical protein
LPIIINSIAIIVCGVAGAVVAFYAVSALGWTGVAAAIAMACIAMVSATVLFVLGTVVGRALHLIRERRP